ncbi:ABC transporter ATP-binding protein [Paenibacillus graminis]|nr:ABC transporter ATP-binding protein [Paenibacillus graminis]MEC0172768.1 ABC transporter ATP-binding protein [Paenibacillus graminis]
MEERMPLPKWNNSELKVAYQCIKPNFILYITGVIGNSITEASIFATIAFVFRDMLNAGANRDYSLLQRGIWIISIEAVVACILLVVFGYMFNVSVKKAMANLRIRIVDRTLDISMDSIDKLHSGDLISRINTDIQTVETIFTNQIPRLIYAIIYGVSSAILMILLNWQIALVVIALGAALITVNGLFMRSFRKAGDQIQSCHGELNTALVDVLDGNETVKLFSMETIMIRKYGEIKNNLLDLTVKRGQIQGILDSINFLLSSLNYVGILVVGSYLVSRKFINLGDIGAIVQFAMGLTFMFQQLGSLLTQLQGSLSGMKRVRELEELPVEPSDYPGGKLLVSGIPDEPVIKCADVSFAYDNDKEVLSHISFQAGYNETIAFVGGSGSGKSTLMKLLLKFYLPTKGTLSVFNTSIKEVSPEVLREQIAYVSQEAYLFQGTLEENIRMGRRGATFDEVAAAAQRANADEFIRDLSDGYQTRIGEGGFQLSGGQIQRVALARAFLSNAGIVLLDEATSALDNTSERMIQKAVDSLREERTVIVIAHKLSTVRNATKIYVLNNGHIQEEGSHEELLSARGMYWRMVERNFTA